MNCPACKQPMYVGLGTQPPVCDNRTCVRYAPSLSERQAGIKFPRPPLPRDAAKEVDVPAPEAQSYAVKAHGIIRYVGAREHCEEYRRTAVRTGTPSDAIEVVPVGKITFVSVLAAEHPVVTLGWSYKFRWSAAPHWPGPSHRHEGVLQRSQHQIKFYADTKVRMNHRLLDLDGL